MKNNLAIEKFSKRYEMGKFGYEQGEIRYEVGKIWNEGKHTSIFSFIPEFTRFIPKKHHFIPDFAHFVPTRREGKREMFRRLFLLENVKKMQNLVAE